ncbi:MAG TPA: hypothetical protein VK116_19685, partial [Planctomycetota bacterium]|nr:hypothetical protein [Planctomycetota bacterium]
MPACAAGSLVVFGAPRRAHTRLRLIEILAASSRRVVVAIVAMPSRSPRIVIVLEARRAPGAILIACADPPRTLLIVFRFARRGLIVAEIALFTTPSTACAAGALLASALSPLSRLALFGFVAL